jgi:hypothetical protein
VGLVLRPWTARGWGEDWGRISDLVRPLEDVVVYFRDMLSAPRAMPKLVSPACISFAMLLMAMRPDEHSRFMAWIGT